jgi:hypothetical protein
VTTAELWALERARRVARLAPGRRKQLTAPPPQTVGQALSGLFPLVDDLGTDYNCVGMGGGGFWAISLDLRYRPGVAKTASRLAASLLREDATPINTIEIALPDRTA